MKLHRFYVGDDSLDENIQINTRPLLSQWNRVLRFVGGQSLILFNANNQQAQYKIVEISKKSANLRKIGNLDPQSPDKQIWLFWSLLKRDNNELILQKCTELGVSNFVPIISERTIKKDFNLPRAEKIIIEAAEQCGRTDIPKIHGSAKLEKIIKNYKDKFQLLVADQNGQVPNSKFQILKTAGFMVGPEGGWTEAETELFEKNNLQKIKISQFTLRAETAATVAISKLL